MNTKVSYAKCSNTFVNVCIYENNSSERCCILTDHLRNYYADISMQFHLNIPRYRNKKRILVSLFGTKDKSCKDRNRAKLQNDGMKKLGGTEDKFTDVKSDPTSVINNPSIQGRGKILKKNQQAAAKMFVSMNE